MVNLTDSKIDDCLDKIEISVHVGEFRRNRIAIREVAGMLLSLPDDSFLRVKEKMRAQAARWQPTRYWCAYSSFMNLMNKETKYRNFHHITCKSPLTDHAFCRALERHLGIDVDAMKNKVMEVAKKEGWWDCAVIAPDGSIKTFLPRGAKK